MKIKAQISSVVASEERRGSEIERVDLPASVCEMVNIYTDVGYDVTPLPQHAWGGTVILSIFCAYGPR